MTRTVAVSSILWSFLTIACAPSQRPEVEAPVDASPAAEPVATPSAAPSAEASPAEAAPMRTALRHPGAPRTRSSGEIVGPEAPVAPPIGQFASPCADRKVGESWDSDGATCMCEPGGQVRCSRWTKQHGKIE